MAGARKGKGEGKIGAREERGEGKRLQPAHCLFRLAPSLICKRLTSTTIVSQWKYSLLFAGTRNARTNVGLNMDKHEAVWPIEKN